jgi:hypothetical protein
VSSSYPTCGVQPADADRTLIVVSSMQRIGQ